MMSNEPMRFSEAPLWIRGEKSKIESHFDNYFEKKIGDDAKKVWHGQHFEWFAELKNRKEKQDNLTLVEEDQYNEFYKLLGFTQHLLNDKGKFHFSSQKTNTFKFDSPIIERLKIILSTEVIDIPSWMCVPTYRDAIVFYDEDFKIITT